MILNDMYLLVVGIGQHQLGSTMAENVELSNEIFVWEDHNK